MIKINLSFAKIVATPTATSWSQAYNAGNFFVVLSLTNETTEDESELKNIGKTIINYLEAEFFGLETKNLQTIKEAVLASLNELPQSATLSLALAYLKDQVLYVLLYGAGNVLLKRENKTGALLQRFEPENEIVSASGYIKQGDLLLLRTIQFVEKIPDNELNNALELTLPNDIAETLTPHIHNTEDGGAAAIVISITGVPAQDTNLHTITPNEEDEENEEDITSYPIKRHLPGKTHLSLPFLSILKQKISSLPIKRIFKNKKRALLILIAGIILVTLLIKVNTALQERKNASLMEAFTPIYQEADEKYQEGQGIASLNPKLATKIYNDALKLINDNISKFPESSDERTKLLSLKEKINSKISEPIDGKLIEAVQVSEKESILLGQFIQNKDAISITENSESLYVLTRNNISEVSKEGKNKEELIENNDDWTDAKSIGTYQGNIYVLDKTKGLIKYVAGSDGYGKTDYFTTEKPNFSNAISIAIDGSIWMLSENGVITKYTKGQKDEFTLENPDVLIKPVQIATGIDMDNIYILDSGGSQIAQYQKDGVLKNSYRADILKNAKAFTISGDEKTIFVLSDNKIWKLNP